VTCGPLTAPSNGEVSYSSGEKFSKRYDVGVVAEYSCGPLFSLEKGSREGLTGENLSGLWRVEWN